MAEVLLVVDDDVDTLRLVGLMLQRQGYSIITASNGQQAINMALEEQPDLILLDVMMPGLDGYEVTRHLRNNPNSAEIPIIMFTAKTQLDDKVSGFESGADDYLTKPTQPRELFAHVKAVLARSLKNRKTTQIKHSQDRGKGKIIGVLSAKGGLGVTTIALNLGIAIYQNSQKDTVVAEFRPGQGTIGLNLGYVRPENMNKLLEVSPSALTIRDVINCLITHNSGIRLLLSSYQPLDSRFISYTASFTTITKHLGNIANYIILDLGPAFHPITEQMVDLCDDLVIIVEPNQNTIYQTQELLSQIRAKGDRDLIKLALVNRSADDFLLEPAQVQQQLGEIIDIICPPAADILFQAENSHTPIMINEPDSEISQQIRRMAELILR